MPIHRNAIKIPRGSYTFPIVLSFPFGSRALGPLVCSFLGAEPRPCFMIIGVIIPITSMDVSQSSKLALGALASPQLPLAGTASAETQEESEEWKCLANSNGVENPLCQKCRSLMCSSGLRQVASADGFVHTLVPPRVTKPWLVPWPNPSNTECPLCKICFALFPGVKPEPVVWSLIIRQGICSLVLESRPHPNTNQAASKTQAICVLAEQGM